MYVAGRLTDLRVLLPKINGNLYEIGLDSYSLLVQK